MRITDVDAERKTVTGDDGSVTPFDKLLLATGSTPLIPPIEGVKKDGVYVFRNLDDTRALLDTTLDQGLQGRRHRRRIAGTRSGARIAGAGLRRDRRPPDGPPDGTPAGPHGRRLSEGKNGVPWA